MFVGTYIHNLCSFRGECIKTWKSEFVVCITHGLSGSSETKNGLFMLFYLVQVRGIGTSSLFPFLIEIWISSWLRFT